MEKNCLSNCNKDVVSKFSLIFKRYYFFFLFAGLIIIVLSSYSAQKRNPLFKMYEIDLTKLPVNENRIAVSRFSSEINYIILEARKESLIGGGVQFFVFDSLIISCAHRQILVFNRHDGKFLRSVGEYSQGPQGFSNSLNAFIKNKKIVINVVGWKNPLIEYSAEGMILNKIESEKMPRTAAWLAENDYAFYYDKNSIHDSIRLQIVDTKGNRHISTFYDFREFNNTSRFTFFGAFFYYYNGALYIKEYFNDTVFQVTKNHLFPYAAFKSGKNSPPFYEKDTFDFVEYHNIQNILETDNFIFFQLYFRKRGYFCYFDKRTNQVMISNYKNLQINGFENDIDGFMPFHPVSLSNRNELIGFLEPYQIKIWFKENPDKARKLPQHIQRLNNIDEMGNPVVMIVKLKE